MSGGGIRASSKFWADLVSGLAAANAPFDAILGFDIQNELHYDIGQAPLSAISGIVTTANGKSYNVSDPVARQAMMDDNLVNFINQVRSAIVQVDPTALVTVSFFPPKGPNSTKAFEDPIHQVIRTYPAICCSTADFIDLHAYLWGLTLPQLVQNYESAGLKTKPLVMFEYGALLSDQVSLEDAAGSLQKWQSDSCANGFSGWALWNWDVAFTVDSSYRPAIAGSDAVNNAMKPSTRPDPCTSGSFAGQNLAGSTTALASKEIAGSLAVNAIDGNPKTVWSAGAFAPQWLELKLPRPAIVSSIRLTTSQSPDGATDHKLYTRGHDGQLQLVSEFAALTKDNQVLTWTPQTPMAGVEAVRIETVTSPSWIAWREVDILSADPSLPAITFIGNGAVFDAAVTPGSWVSILGSGLAASSRAWDAADFSGSILPKKLDGVAVTFNGAPASLYYVSPSQINLQAPAMPTGQPVTVTVTRAAVQATASANVVSTANDPGLFSYFVSGVRYSAAVFTDGTILGDPSALPGTRSAKAGDHLAFYGTGFASSASGVLFDLPVALPDPVTCTIGGQKATVEYAGLVSPGLFQINVVMPNLAAGNYPVVIGYHGAITSLPPVVPVR